MHSHFYWGDSYRLKPLSGCTTRVPVNVPSGPLRNVPLFTAMALPIPPMVSPVILVGTNAQADEFHAPVESVALDGMRPKATKPYDDIIR